MCFAFLVYGFLNYGRMTVGMYYFTYVWGDVSLFTLYATVNGLICAVAAFFSAALVKLCRGKRGALLLSYGLSFILNIILFFLSPENASSTLVLVLLFGTGIFNGFCTALLYGMIGDTVEYGQWKTGVRADGLCSSGTSFMLKLGGAIAPTMLLAMLAANGYAEGAATQTAGALSTMNVVMNLVPAILAAISFPAVRVLQARRQAPCPDHSGPEGSRPVRRRRIIPFFSLSYGGSAGPALPPTLF